MEAKCGLGLERIKLCKKEENCIDSVSTLTIQKGNSGGLNGTGISLYFLLEGRTSQIVSVVPLEK